MIEILYHIDAFGTINDGAVCSIELLILRPHSKITNFWAIIVGLDSHFKPHYHCLYLVFSNIHRPDADNTMALCKKIFYLGT